jgi:long-chain fatty acid transport protein
MAANPCSRGAGALTAAVLLSLILGPSPRAQAQGLEAFDSSARAAGVAGAFTAQVDDASAVRYNPGALGLLKKRKGASVGGTMTQPSDQLYQGLPPGPGAGTAAERTTTRAIVPYVFATVPIGSRVTGGIGYYTPMRLDSEWSDPALYAGRAIATRSRIETADLAGTFGIAVTRWLGIGGGAVYRTSRLESARRIGAQLGATTFDVATLDMKTDSVRSLGWNAGVLIRPSAAFSIGLRYQSAIDVDYTGAGRLTQIATGDAQFDQLIAASFPLGADIGLESTLRFPGEAAVGIAFAAGKPLLIEIGATRTDWKAVDTLPFNFPNNLSFNTSYPLALRNATTYRAGLRFQRATGPQFRLGYALAKSPQPDSTVGPFLTDADRSTITAGFGLDWLDIAAGYTMYKDREIVTNTQSINGVYRANAWSVTLSVTK